MLKVSIDQEEKNTSVDELSNEYLLHYFIDELTVVIEPYPLYQTNVYEGDKGVHHWDKHWYWGWQDAAVSYIFFEIMTKRVFL